MVYYGLGLNVGNLAGNVYVNFTMASAVETLAYVLCILLLDRAGRKSLHCISMIVSGLACLATIFPVLYGHGCESELAHGTQAYCQRWCTYNSVFFGRGCEIEIVYETQ